MECVGGWRMRRGVRMDKKSRARGENNEAKGVSIDMRRMRDRDQAAKQ